jgi:hypothetical protein
MYVVHYVPAVAGGGLTPGAYQAYLYGPSVGGNNIGELFYGNGLGNNWTVLSMNRGFPLDAARLGSITGTGASQNVAVLSIASSSRVGLSFVGGTAAPAFPLVTITPNVGFAVSLPAGACYNYEVIG